MLLPTILATLFMFTVVITLNKASSLSRGGKIIRLISVDDLFPTEAEVEAMRKKPYYEATPPPSPEAVLGALEPATVPLLVEEPPAPAVLPVPPARSQSAATTPRVTSIPVADIPLPIVSPDTSLPPPAPAPAP